MRSCHYCGFHFHYHESQIAKYEGKRYHVGCLEHKINARKKTLAMLSKIEKTSAADHYAASVVAGE